MFKFNIKTDNIHSFNMVIDNIHNFKSKVNNTFEFVLKSNHATILKKLNIREETKSKLIVGNTNLKLFLFKDTKLKDLPITLKQFAGLYVYVRAKLRFYNITQGVSSIYNKIITKGVIDNITTSILDLKSVLKAKASFHPNHTESNIIMRAARVMNGKLYNTSIYEAGEISDILQAKARTEDSTSTSEEFETTLCAKAKLINCGKSNISMGYYQGKSKKLSLYTEVKLNELPMSLKGFCFDFANESWEDVLNGYATWSDVKTNVSTWNNLMN